MCFAPSSCWNGSLCLSKNREHTCSSPLLLLSSLGGGCLVQVSQYQPRSCISKSNTVSELILQHLSASHHAKLRLGGSGPPLFSAQQSSFFKKILFIFPHTGAVTQGSSSNTSCRSAAGGGRVNTDPTHHTSTWEHPAWCCILSVHSGTVSPCCNTAVTWNCSTGPARKQGKRGN